MKGVVFRKYPDFVAGSFEPEMIDDIIEDANPSHGGAYTSVGTYPYTEVATPVGDLGRRTGTPVPELPTLFGDHLRRRVVVKYSELSEGQTCLSLVLDSVDSHIHGEVHELYPDAEPPVSRMARRGAHAINFDYESRRPLEALAAGTIRAAAEHFRQPVAIATSRIEGPAGVGARFSIQHAA